MSKFLPKSREGVAPGEYYHIFNRGAHKQGIFKNKADWIRFLFSVLYLQSPHSFANIHRITKSFTAETGFSVPDEDIQSVIEGRFVELVSFCLMPNHFHLLVKESLEGGVARFMHRVSVGYTRYFNTKYGSVGHVFQGPYKAVHVETDSQLLYLSAYIHRNPRELGEWLGKEGEYPWSSLQDFTDANRWGGLIVPEIVTSQFAMTPKSNYADFVKTSTSKLLAEELEGLIS